MKKQSFNIAALIIASLVLAIAVGGAVWLSLDRRPADDVTSTTNIPKRCVGTVITPGASLRLSTGQQACTTTGVALNITRIVVDRGQTLPMHHIKGYRVDLGFRLNDAILLPDEQGNYQPGEAIAPLNYRVIDTDGSTWAEIMM